MNSCVAMGRQYAQLLVNLIEHYIELFIVNGGQVLAGAFLTVQVIFICWRRSSWLAVVSSVASGCRVTRCECGTDLVFHVNSKLVYCGNLFRSFGCGASRYSRDIDGNVGFYHVSP